MSFDYTEIAATAHEILAEFGQSVTITHYGESVYDSDTGKATRSETTEAGTAVELEYESRDIDGALILRGDKRLLLSAVGIAAPVAGDSVTIGGSVYAVMNVKPLSPGGVAVLYEVQARA